jgi:hypothetical protein
MARIDPDDLADDLADDNDAELSLDAPRTRDRDGVASLHDSEGEAGDEEGLNDTYDMDDREAKELSVQLDDRDEPEPELD